ncbi:MAG: AAA family ATPase [Bacteroidetes bacterium 4572_112]|nr:MAG: AAA family ATPase [Bacteroidetes bacterium 4572_112]
MIDNKYTNDKEAFISLVDKYNALRNEIAKVIVGQDDVVRDLLISIFSNGHSLLVGVPGLAKTLMVNTLAQTLGLNFKRIQFTPDLMPSDIIGTEILDENKKFNFIQGPVFSNIVLADEINRTPPKTQAALLEAMQERTVTVAGKEYTLDKPFFVLATQNPIEQEGTYPLPEAQLDRFMFNLILDYPAFQEELDIVKGTTGAVSNKVNNIISGEEILYFQQLIRKLPVVDNVYEYAVKLVNLTRPNRDMAHELTNKYLLWGAINTKTRHINRLYFPITALKIISIAILRHAQYRLFLQINFAF